MNEMKKYLVTILFACLLAGPIGIIYADDSIPHLQVTMSNTGLTAGSSGSVVITFYNGGNFDVTQVEALLSSTTPGVSILNGSQYVNNLIVAGTSASNSVTVFVDQSVGIGAYPIMMTLSYLRTPIGIVTETIPLTLRVTQAFLPLLDLSTANTEIVAGELNNVTVMVRNTAGGSLSNLDFIVTSPSTYLAPVDSSKFHIDKINASDASYLHCKLLALQSIPVGAYPITITMLYSDSADNRLKQIVSLPLEVIAPSSIRSPIVTIGNTGTSSVVPGESFTLPLEVNCTEATSYNTVTSLTLDSTGLLNPLSQTVISLGDLKPGSSVPLAYKLILDGSASPGQIPVKVNVSYTDAKGQPGSTSGVFTIVVSEFTRFTLLSNQTFTATQGSTLSISSTLLLIGSSPTKYTNIEAVAAAPFTSQAGSNEYLGAIDPDSPVPFTVTIGTANAQPGSYTLHLSVSYYNDLNTQVVKTINVPVVITQLSTRTTGGTTTSGGDLFGWIRDSEWTS